MANYSSLGDFRDSLLTYLNNQKQFLQEDIDSSRLMTDDEKIAKGLLIVNAVVLIHENDEYQMGFQENLTKVRPGDKVELQASDGTTAQVIVVENQSENMIIHYDGDLPLTDHYRIVVNSVVSLDPLIKLLEQIDTGQPGAFFLKLLANLDKPVLSDKDGIQLNETDNCYLKLNKEQKENCKKALMCPSIYSIQGPPGTGKTKVLSVIARAIALDGKNVLILAKTHQAVNVALNNISQICNSIRISKIGSKLKSVDLHDAIKIYEKYYLFQKAFSKKLYYTGSPGEVVGMTMQGAIVNLGLAKTNFRPDVILVDEASQLTLAESSVIGAFGASSVIFFGDDKQMPPIFHEKQQHDCLSISIFTHLVRLYPSFEGKLCVSYRMNEEITQYVSQHFYEPYGEKLLASDYSKSRKLILEGHHSDSRINKILASNKSIITIDVTSSNTCEDSNPEEADFIADFVEYLIKHGISFHDIAVVTPFRRQVLKIRNALKDRISNNIPLVDTVERLQGQSVDIVILSFCVSSKEYYKSNIGFLLNHNRLNVMISRAKKKVLIVKPALVNLKL